MTLVTTISGGPNLVTTIEAAPISGAALTVVGVLATALSVGSTPIVLTQINIGQEGAPGTIAGANFLEFWDPLVSYVPNDLVLYSDAGQNATLVRLAGAPPSVIGQDPINFPIGWGWVAASIDGSVGGAPAWGAITGTLASQTDLQAALNAKLATAAFTWTSLSGKPSDFPPSAHGHLISDVSGLQTALDGKQIAGSYASASHTHAIGDVTGLSAALTAKLDTVSFTWTNLSGKPSTFPPDAHVHTIANVTGLQPALDGKQAAGSYAAASHSHVIGDVTGLSAALTAKLDTASFTWTGLSGKPSTFPPESHTHVVSEITDFVASVRAQIEAALIAGANVTITPAGTGATRTFTLASSGGGGGGGGLAGSVTVTLPHQSRSHTQTVAAVGVTPSSIVLIGFAPVLDTEENDPVFLSPCNMVATPGVDQITVTLLFASQESGPIKLNWSAI